MALKDRVSFDRLSSIQKIKNRTWTQLLDKDNIGQIVMPTGSTSINVWVSFNQPLTLTERPTNWQFATVRKDGTTTTTNSGVIDGNITARHNIRMPSLGDIAFTYVWELWSDGVTPLSVYVWHDAAIDISIDAYEAHYKHIPEVIVASKTQSLSFALPVVTVK